MKISVFLKGLLMGICDLVPGISGGTIALITGIYERLINSVQKLLTYSAISKIFLVTFLFFIGQGSYSDLRKRYTEYDLYFLFNLLLGILVAIFFGSYFILYLLANYFVFTMSFFIGLILASSFIIYGKIEDHKFSHRMFGVLGLLIGFSLLFLIPSSVDISLFYVFLSGFVGITAMFLPGISGSFLLYIMGSYEYVLLLINGFSYLGLFVFLLGAVLGASFVSKLISYLLKVYHSQTFYFLLGFVVGALFIPLRDVYFLIAPGMIGISGLFFFIGALIVLIFNKIT